MILKYIKLTFLFILIFTFQLSAQQNNHWSKTGKTKISNTELQSVAKVKKYETFTLKVDDFKSSLKKAPNKDADLKTSAFQMQFPDANGKMIRYYVKEAPVMHPALQKKFPNNRSYIGVGVVDSSLRVRFSVNDMGLHAMLVDKNRKVQYIDPVAKNKTKYRVYNRKDLDVKDKEFQCFAESLPVVNKAGVALKSANDKKLRTYRLALAVTGEYAQFHIAKAGVGNGTEDQKKGVVLSELATLITRVNDVYENELAISLQLVANNDALIYLDPETDPYTNDDGSKLLNENQTTCDGVIGTSNYDLGHVLSTDGTVSRATKASVCTSNSKARAATGSGNPTGDNFYFDFVAHEIGHQFGANHTFNGTSGNCAGANRNDDTAVEPGSGSTLMGYAGLCSPQNVQNHSDLYFHVVSIDEIWANIEVGTTGTCAAVTDLTSNKFAPVANAGNDISIPKSTPFILRGQGSDADNDPISFCWEQIDNEITAVPPSETATSGAVYRSLSPTIIGNRYMPSLQTVVGGDLSSVWEVTPSVGRVMNFKLTVRDNNPEGGQVNSDALKVTVSNAAGPFLVTSQNTDNLIWDENTTQNITWDVAGTDANGVHVSQVNILLSTDGGKTFTEELISNTPNDGTQDITVPNMAASSCFVMVEAVDNLFYAINTKSFSIGEFNEVCNAGGDAYGYSGKPIDIPDNDLDGVVSTINVPDNFKVEKIKVAVKINHTWVSDLTLTLQSPSGTVIELLSGACFDPPNDDIDVVFDDAGDHLICSISVDPPVISGNIKPNEAISGFAGENSLGAWKLKVIDDTFQDFGEIETWSIDLCTSEQVLAINSYVFDDFSVYPNPSNGMIHVSFKSVNTSDVAISLFDMLGRKILRKTYFTSAPSFKETLNMGHVSSGLYILQVKRGNEISSQRIHIK